MDREYYEENPGSTECARLKVPLIGRYVSDVDSSRGMGPRVIAGTDIRIIDATLAEENRNVVPNLLPR
jgi:hypothetical protein